MQANVGRDTLPERLLRQELTNLGLRYRKHVLVAPRCRADIVFASCRVCVFVDGCFWHGCPTHFHLPKANAAWWQTKIDRTRQRDAARTSELRKDGWTVIRLWEHASIKAGAARIARV